MSIMPSAESEYCRICVLPYLRIAANLGVLVQGVIGSNSPIMVRNGIQVQKKA